MADLLSESKERLTSFWRKDKSTSSDQSNEDRSYQKRRAQVRRAQKSHRERKNEYIFGIEQELRRVRDQHIKQILEVENENQQLRNILAAYQIVVPPPLRNAPVVEESEIYGQQSHFAQIRVHRSQSSVPPMGVSITPTGEKRMLTTHYGSTPRNGGSQQAEETDLEEIQMAVNFVLALEHCFMGHLHTHGQADTLRSSPDNRINPTGHELLMAQQLLNQQPTTKSYNTISHPSWEVSMQTVQNLLRLSDQFSLPGELTPAQAWRNVRQLPDFTTISVSRIAKLQEILAREVKCYGFGAVLDNNILKVALEAYATGLSSD